MGHARIEKVLSEWVQILIFFFKLDEGIEDLNVSINWPSCHLAGGPMMAQHHMLAG